MLLAFLHAADAADADERLSLLIEREVRPLVTRVLRQKAGGTAVATPADVEDMAATCAASVLERLTDLRAGRDVEPIASLSAYVAVVAYNGWHRFMRELFPVRARLKNRFRYLCGHHPALALWTDAAGALVCGLASWRRVAQRVEPAAQGRGRGDRAMPWPERSARIGEAASSPRPRQRRP